jgi:hypothetical protein
MKLNAKLKLAVGLGILGCQVAHNPAYASRSIGAPVLEVCEVVAMARGLKGKEVSIYGEILFINHDSIIVRDGDHHQHSILVDIRQPIFRQRFSRDCPQSGCSAIITGLLDGTVLRATASFPYKSPFQSPAACRQRDLPQRSRSNAILGWYPAKTFLKV